MVASSPATKAMIDAYHRLLEAYGHQGWWPGESPFEMIVGAILTQSTAWANVEKALGNLKEAGVLTPDGLTSMSEADLAILIYPSGYYNSKATKLKAFVALLEQQFNGDLSLLLSLPLQELRKLLLGTHGIGPETADSIVLYAGGKPIFVVDAYTKRIFRRLGLVPPKDTYDGWQAMFMDNLPTEKDLFNNYHALIVRHGKFVCRREPRCLECPLLSMCPAGLKVTGNESA